MVLVVTVSLVHPAALHPRLSRLLRGELLQKSAPGAGQGRDEAKFLPSDVAEKVLKIAKLRVGLIGELEAEFGD